MRIRKKKSLLDQAAEQATELAEAVRPHLEQAVGTARDRTTPVIADARAKAAPVIADARAKAAPVVADARERAATGLGDARGKAAPAVAAGAALAAERAGALRDLADAKMAELKGEPTPTKGARLRKRLGRIVLLATLGGIAAVVAKRLRGGEVSAEWQSAPTPTPETAAAAGAPKTDDAAAATPDEALADETEVPHATTTPDAPLETVEIDDDRR